VRLSQYSEDTAADTVGGIVVDGMVDYVHGDNAAALDDAAAVHSIVVEHYTRKYRIIVFGFIFSIITIG